MKVLVLNIEYPPIGGGAAYVSQSLSEGFFNAGVQTTVLTMGLGLESKRETVNGIDVIRIGCGRKRLNASSLKEHIRFINRAKKYLSKFLKEHKFDICHCHFLVPTGILALWLKRRYKIPFVVTIHGSDVPGHNPAKYKVIHRCITPLIKRVALKASLIVSPSTYLKEKLCQELKLSADRNIIVIPNGIEQVRNQKKIEKKKIILSSGRLLSFKGFDTLIRAVSKEDVGYEVHICGDGPMKEKLINISSTSKTKVVFHGWLDNKSLKYQSLLRDASIYVLVSYRENASVAILEAMNNSCAIITSDTTGCKEMVEGVGTCVPYGRDDILKVAIDELIYNEPKRLNMQSLAYDKVNEKYRWEGIVNDYLMQLEPVV